nr:28S ribosomal protein S28, mitochondrial isoform X2 [Vulpes vulpes]
MAALCRARAATAESRFLRGFPFRRPCRGTGTGSSSGSESPDATEPEMRQGGFASALERHSKLRRKAELGGAGFSKKYGILCVYVETFSSYSDGTCQG